MIATASHRKGSTSRSRSSRQHPDRTSAAGLERATKACSSIEVRARREALFSREIDYIACPQFRNKNASRLASEAPASAAVPLERFDSPPASGAGLTPYIASLYQTRLIDKDEEQFYFRRMNWLKYQAASLRRRLDPKRATRKQIETVEGLLAEAETVKAILITSNLRLVVSIAKKFVDATWSLDELISEGNIALMRSVEKFNFALGNRFSTYATYAIQRHFFRLSDRGRQLRKRFVFDDEPLREQAEGPHDSEYRSAEQIAMLKEVFTRFLADLEPRERSIVVARFGFDGKPPRTFRELGSSMGVCKERIRQIQSRAMEKLREFAAEAKLEQTVGDWL